MSFNRPFGLSVSLVAVLLLWSLTAQAETRADQLERVAAAEGITIRSLHKVHGPALPQREDGTDPSLEALLKGLGHSLLFDGDGKITKVVILRGGGRKPSLDPGDPQAPEQDAAPPPAGIALGKKLFGGTRAWRLSSAFGERRDPLSGKKQMHWGIDFAGRRGTAIYAPAPGKLIDFGRKGSFGRFVLLEHEGGLRTFYAHLSRFATGLKRGQAIAEGEQIGSLGSSGRVTGPHLHFEIRRASVAVDPLTVGFVE